MARPPCDDVSFAIREGEIVGVAGVAGNGQRELAEALSGMRDIRAGSMRVGGKQLRGGDPREAILAGVAHVPEDRLGTGLAPSLSVTSNVVIKTYRTRSLSRGPLLASDACARRPSGIIGRYDVKTPGPGTPVRNLSGGNLQKLVLGREFADDPLVLVVAQPTRGLDVGAIETVHSYLRDAAAKGVAILLMSEDLDEIRALADRILVIYEGEIVGELQAGIRVDRGDRAAHGRRNAAREARATSHAAVVAVGRGPGRVARRRVRVHRRRARSDRARRRGDVSRDLDAGFTGNGAMSATLVSATPILFTGLAAAAAFRMQLFNIGAEGQLYLGAVGASWIALQFGDRRRDVDAALRRLDVRRRSRHWARCGRRSPVSCERSRSTNEIITSLMLNYVAGLLLVYLIFDSSSYWRDTSTLQARSFPQGKPVPDAAYWPTFGSSVVVPLGFAIGLAAALGLWVLYSRMRFGFEVSVMADSPRAARYSGMRTRRKILAVMALSGAMAGIGGASQIGDFNYTLDGSPNGLQAAAFGYTGIVVAALARYNPFAVCLVAVLIGGLLNAGYTLQGPDFPSGLVGVMQGIILFCALGGELLLRYRLRIGRVRAAKPAAEAAS